MKKYIVYVICCICCMTSCYNDDSTVADKLVSDISISGIAEEGYTVVSLVGNRLNVSPTVTSGYNANELSYEWYLIDQAAESVYHPETDTDYHFDREHIASGLTLDYEVNLSPGQYTLVFEVQAPNGYTVSQTATLNAVTSFSQGFYILKATPDGKTELDLFNPTDGTFLENVLTLVHGAPFDGAPQNLSTAVSHCYIDTETNEANSGNLVTVTTQDGQIRAMRTSDLRVVLDRQNILFTSIDEDEKPYRIVSGFWGNYLVTSNGLRFQYNATTSLSNSGKYGLESTMAASPYVVYEEGSTNVFFWDAESHSVGVCDYNGTTTLVEDERYKLSGLVRMECVAAGFNQATSYVVFVLSSLDGLQRQLVLLSAGFGGGTEVETMRALRVNKINDAHLWTVCYSSAALLYGVVGNNIYAMDLTTFAEQEITPKGIGDDERIVYISNQSAGAYGGYDYLVVGTLKDDKYTLRFYNLLGGQPDGEAVYTLQGIGTPRALHFTEQQANSFNVIPFQD